MIRILKYGEVPNSEIFLRGLKKKDVSGAVAAILADVRERGDAALLLIQHHAFVDFCNGRRLTALKLAVSGQIVDHALKDDARCDFSASAFLAPDDLYAAARELVAVCRLGDVTEDCG